MPFSRYNRKTVVRTNTQEYTKQLRERKVPHIDHYSTVTFNYPSDDVLGSLRIDKEYWGVGTRFYKLAAKYYGDPGLWFIIPWFNKVPLESDYSPGDVIMIPHPLEIVLEYFRE